MFDVLKELTAGDALTLDDARTHDMTQTEDFRVVGGRCYTSDEGELVILELDGGFHLVAHTFRGEPRYYVYELNMRGDLEQLESEGVPVLNAENEFRGRFLVRGPRPVPMRAVIGPIYGLTVERDDRYQSDCVEAACCEYRSKSHHYPVTFFERCDTHLNVYQGIRISETSIVI